MGGALRVFWFLVVVVTILNLITGLSQGPQPDDCFTLSVTVSWLMREMTSLARGRPSACVGSLGSLPSLGTGRLR